MLSLCNLIMNKHLDVLASVSLTRHELSPSVCSLKKKEVHFRNHYEARNKPSTHSDLISSVCPTLLASDSLPFLLWRSFFQLGRANNCSSQCVNTVYHSVCQCSGRPWTPEIGVRHLDKQKITVVRVCMSALTPMCSVWRKWGQTKSRTPSSCATSKRAHSLHHLCPLCHISPRDLIPFL